MPKRSTLHIDGDPKGALNAINKTTTNLGRAVGDVQKMGSGLTGALSGFTGLLTNLPFMAAAAVTGMVAGFAVMIKSSLQAMETLDKMSQRIGVSVEFLSTLGYSASLAGTNMESVEKALQRLSRNLFDADRGLLTAKIAFDQLGVSIKESNGELRKGENILFEVADKFSKMEDGTLKTALALQLFGRAGAQMIPMLNEGSEGLKKQQEEARKLGLEISTNTAKQAATLNDNMDILKMSMQGAANTVATELLPTLVSMSGNLVDVATNTNTVSVLAEGLVTVLKVMASALIAVGGIVYELGASLGTLGATMAKIVTFDFEGAGQVWEQGWKDVADFGEATIDLIDALWAKGKDVNQTIADMKKLLQFEAETENAKKLAKEWESLNRTLSNDIAKTALPDIIYQIYLIDQRFTEYTNKFPGHIQKIEEWREAMVQAASDIGTIQPKDVPLPQFPNKFEMLPIDQESIDYYKTLNDQMIMESSRVTTAELANLALREGVFSDTMGNMADAFYTFANISKNTNKGLFTAYKIFAIGEASIATYLAATKALAEVPFPFNFVAAASVIVAGLANVARIASMQPGSAVGGGVGSAPAINERQISNLNNDNRKTNFTINFYGGGFDGDKDKLARDIIDSLNKATEDGLILNTTGRG